MVDEGRVARLLRQVSERTARLGEAAARPADERESLWLDGVKYLFVTTIEGCVDVAQHIASSERWAPPDSNAASVRALGERGVIDAELGAALARAVGLRNVLEHQYAAVDDTIVIAALDRLAEFDRFVSDVSAWLIAQR
jgi:uncharacterized protein YutE (UPF0331/DUF86 family)